MKTWQYFLLIFVGLVIFAIVSSGTIWLPVNGFVPIKPIFEFMFWVQYEAELIVGLALTASGLILMICLVVFIGGLERHVAGLRLAIPFFIVPVLAEFTILAAPYDVHPIETNVNFKISLGVSIFLAVLGTIKIWRDTAKKKFSWKGAALAVLLLSPIIFFGIVIPSGLWEFVIPIIFEGINT